MKNKLWILTFLTILLSPFWGGQSVFACNGQEVKISGRINYPPLSWSSGGVLKGSTISLVENALAELGIKSRTEGDVPWKRVLKNAKEGEIDIVVGVRKTEQRNEFLHFVEPAITPAVQSLFYHVDREVEYDQWSDLSQLTGSIVLGSSFGKAFDNYMLENLDIEQVESVEQNFKKLVKNRVDYLIGPFATTNLYLEKEGLSAEIVSNRKPIVVLEEFIAISKSSPCLALSDKLGAILTRMNQSGEMAEEMEEHFILWFEEFGITDEMFY